MGGRMSKQKGSRAELEVAEVFAAWTGDAVRRTPLSGGWSKDPGYGVAGDLVFQEVETLHCEVKNQESWRLEDLLTGKNKDKIWAWWGQCTGECHPGKLPILVFTRNLLPFFVMFPAYAESTPSLSPIHRAGNFTGEVLALVEADVLVMKLDDFVKTYKLVKPKLAKVA